TIPEFVMTVDGSCFIDSVFFFFFFQAEDGIRDKLVTGVQTCALPISPRSPSSRRTRPGSSSGPDRSRAGERPPGTRCGGCGGSRSEERRVGKECRSRWWPDQ